MSSAASVSVCVCAQSVYRAADGGERLVMRQCSALALALHFSFQETIFLAERGRFGPSIKTHGHPGQLLHSLRPLLSPCRISRRTCRACRIGPRAALHRLEEQEVSPSHFITKLSCNRTVELSVSALAAICYSANSHREENKQRRLRHDLAPLPC
ncbi:uncharacterized [Tachysurus ichikawai]